MNVLYDLKMKLFRTSVAIPIPKKIFGGVFMANSPQTLAEKQ